MPASGGVPPVGLDVLEAGAFFLGNEEKSTLAGKRSSAKRLVPMVMGEKNPLDVPNTERP